MSIVNIPYTLGVGSGIAIFLMIDYGFSFWTILLTSAAVGFVCGFINERVDGK